MSIGRTNAFVIKESEPIAGYAINDNGTIYFQDLNGSPPEIVSSIKIVDTGVDEPAYCNEDTQDPYSEGLLYSNFINGGTAWSDPSEGIITTDNYSSNVETVNGITARRFYGNEFVSTTAGNSRNVFSYSVWIKKYEEEWVANDYPIGTNGTAGIMLGSDGHNANLVPYICGIAFNYATTNWYHYVVTYDGSTFNFYMNSIGGNQSANAQRNDFSIFPDSSSGLIFGKQYPSSTSEYFDGYMANFRLYDHVLSSDEITALYNELTPTDN